MQRRHLSDQHHSHRWLPRSIWQCDQAHTYRPMTSIRPLPPAELLWDLFSYDPIKGRLVWKNVLQPCSRRLIGQIAGHIDAHGYTIIQVQNFSYKAHRLIYKWVTGVNPSGIVEHIDDNKGDNRIHSLLDSDSRSNAATRQITNAGDLKGYKKCGDKFHASIYIDGKDYHLGSFDKPSEATNAYLEARQKYHDDASWRPSPVTYSSPYKWASKVTTRKGTIRWQANVKVNGIPTYVGSYSTDLAAHIMAAAYRLEHDPFFHSDD